MSFKQTQCTSFLGGLLDGMITVVTLIMMFVYSPKLATIALVVMVLYGLIRAVMYNPLRQATEENIVQGAKQQSHFLETLRGLKTIKLFNRQADEKAGCPCLSHRSMRVYMCRNCSWSRNRSMGCYSALEGLLIIWLGSKMVINIE